MDLMEIQNIPEDKFNQMLDKIKLFSQREKAVGKLKRSGVVFPPKSNLPEEYLDEDGAFKMPSDITKLENWQLGELMSIVNAQLSWTGACLASSRVDRHSAERIKNYVESTIRMTLFADEKTEKRFKAREDKEAYVNVNEMVQHYQLLFDKEEALVLILEQLYKDLERSFNLVSREITRRGGEFRTDTRTDNVK